MGSLGFLKYSIISTANRVLLLPFQFGCLSFLFFVWLLWLGLPALCWIRGMKEAIPLLFQISGVKLIVLLVNYDAVIVICGLVIFRYIYTADSCHLKWVPDFIKCFSCNYWYDHVTLSFVLFMWCITFIDLWMLNQLCILRINLTLSWCMIFLTCCCILFANVLLKILASMFIRHIGL